METSNRETQINLQTQDFITQSPQIKTPDVVFSKQTGNPFLKKNGEINVKKNPLGLTDITSTENLPSTSSKTVEVTEKTDSEETFVSWFSKTKATLTKAHPEMSEQELIQLGMKLYKKIGEKRKARDDDDGNKRKQPKLSAFAFSKNK